MSVRSDVEKSGGPPPFTWSMTGSSGLDRRAGEGGGGGSSPALGEEPGGSLVRAVVGRGRARGRARPGRLVRPAVRIAGGNGLRVVGTAAATASTRGDEQRQKDGERQVRNAFAKSHDLLRGQRDAGHERTRVRADAQTRASQSLAARLSWPREGR